MRNLRMLLAILALSSPALAQSKSLYQRLGGYDAIAAVTDDFIGRLAGDPKIAPFFAGHSQDSLKKIRQLLVDQLCQAAGGPCIYLGRDMKTVHNGLNITDMIWTSSLDHLKESLDKFKVGPQEQSDVMAFVASLKQDIVQGK